MISRILAFGAISLLLAGCQHTAAHPESATPEVSHAVAVLKPTAGNAAAGTVRFTAVPGGVEIAADLGGLTPGQHGFHIHQYGDCSAPDGTSAGGHYNPAGVAHGNATDAQRHVGDLGNISANSDGVAAYRRIDHQIQLNGPESIIGRGVIVHEKPDQFSQPTGAAGGRVACGAIAIRQP